MESPAADWREQLAEELAFWRRWLSEDAFAAYRNPRLPSKRPLDSWVRDLVDAPIGARVRILDVGSGPLSTLGNDWPGRSVDLTLADPLAHEYNALLVEHGLSDRAVIVPARGEELDRVFPHDHFDFVHSANALDHAYDPLRCLQNMLMACKPGGWVGVITVENEGERQGYTGLHQWNFTVTDGRLRLWNPRRSFFVDETLNHLDRCVVLSVDHGGDLPLFRATMRRVGSHS